MQFPDQDERPNKGSVLLIFRSGVPIFYTSRLYFVLVVLIVRIWPLYWSIRVPEIRVFSINSVPKADADFPGIMQSAVWGHRLSKERANANTLDPRKRNPGLPGDPLSFGEVCPRDCVP